MESPNKRVKISPSESDFVSLDVSGGSTDKYGYDNEIPTVTNKTATRDRPPAYQTHDRRVQQDRRHAQDRPKEKFELPGHSPWILVKTKLGRKFVHNVQTKQSLWRIPSDLIQAVKDLDLHEHSQKEKVENARWAEEQLKKMRDSAAIGKSNPSQDPDTRSRRRRSESLQREDEAALMAELNAEAEQASGKETGFAVTADSALAPQVGDHGYDSDGESYEYVEVTDSEGENETDKAETDGSTREQLHLAQRDEVATQDNDGPVEFGEDDIAFQLAAMGEEYGLDPGEYGDDADGQWEEGAEGLPLSDEDAINLFHDLLEDSEISPFTPWDRVTADESSTSILYDDRYTVLPNMKARKAAWDSWTKAKIEQIRAERARMEKSDPRIAYLAFLSSKATPKLYWPEFKRKYKREPELVERRMTDREREKLYRDHIGRLKLPESTRKADLIALLEALPLRTLNRATRIESLPPKIQTHVNFISLPPEVRGDLISMHIKKLPPPDQDELNMAGEVREVQVRKHHERQKREAALAAREKV